LARHARPKWGPELHRAPIRPRVDDGRDRRGFTRRGLLDQGSSSRFWPTVGLEGRLYVRATCRQRKIAALSDPREPVEEVPGTSFELGEDEMFYRVYLFDGDGQIRAGESFISDDDVEAAEIAASLHLACADAFAGYELWRGTECVAKRRTEDIRNFELKLSALILARQERLLDIEERLQEAFVSVGASERLLRATPELRRKTRR
jgi:hypothetical protein